MKNIICLPASICILALLLNGCDIPGILVIKNKSGGAAMYRSMNTVEMALQP
ncbi:MAG: hypothetical protein JKY52_04600 [Flavobacteriales bacterium]|nr:hypothetical protein [Flavobacteriales bacterium]